MSNDMDDLPDTGEYSKKRLRTSHAVRTHHLQVMGFPADSKATVRYLQSKEDQVRAAVPSTMHSHQNELVHCIGCCHEIDALAKY